jgi:prevent-host-death family protein
MKKTTTVGTFQAKTHLSDLLDRVEKGEEVVITRHGAPLARLVRYEADHEQARTRAAIATLAKAKRGLRLPKGSTLRELREEGRR